MWMSELSRRAGVPVATIKYYLREGLLPPGEAVGATRARYDEGHVHRLRLIRALVGTGGLTLAGVRAVLDTLGSDGDRMHEVLGAACGAITVEVPEPSPVSVERVDALLDRLGWQVYRNSPPRALLASALDTLVAVGTELDDGLLEVYATAAERVGAAEVAALPVGDPARTVERAVVVTALAEPVLLALRRLAQEHASAERYGRPDLVS